MTRAHHQHRQHPTTSTTRHPRRQQTADSQRAYYELHGSLAAPRGAAITDVQIGQWLTNIRRPGGLGKDPVRAQRPALWTGGSWPRGAADRGRVRQLPHVILAGPVGSLRLFPVPPA
ncbi:helicase associated domain-containing protein [Streptomyces erythrochromogenes]|uniref:helicase associated domain-containing protein n=1 Tax=Streptomyces erythrochromogenes TaxID=285574 RepID=UPI00382DBCB5